MSFSKDDFGREIEKLETLICSYGRSRGLDESDIGDFCQQVMTIALEKLGHLRDSQKFSSWVMAIARNLVSRHYRDKIKQPLSLEVLEEDNGGDPPARDEDPESVLLDAERQRQIDDDVGWLLDEARRLPPRQQSCFTLRFFQDRDLQSIAKTLMISVGTVKSTLATVREKLRKKRDERDAHSSVKGGVS
ncbi:Sigma-70 family RNA polymerase sigma factor [Sulfidibacter corallicola]